MWRLEDTAECVRQEKGIIRARVYRSRLRVLIRNLRDSDLPCVPLRSLCLNL